MKFLHWIKYKNKIWNRNPNFVNLANSGIVAPNNLFWEHRNALLHADSYLLGSDYSNEWGHEALINEIRQRYQVPETHIIIPTAGASSAISIVYHALLSLGKKDRVIIETPTYEPLFQVAQYLGAQIDWIERKFETGHQIDPDQLFEIMTPQTKLLVLTNLHNPTGVLINNETMLRIAQVVNHINPLAKILVDETFLDFIDPLQPSAFSLNTCCISINSLSKVYGLGTSRIGWIIAPNCISEAIKEAWLNDPNIGSKWEESLGVIIFRNIDKYIQHWSSILEKNRPLVQQASSSLNEILEGEVSAFGCLWFPRLRLPQPDEFFETIEHCQQVGLSPGRFFRCDRHFRLGFGVDPEVLSNGLIRLVETWNSH